MPDDARGRESEEHRYGVNKGKACDMSGVTCGTWRVTFAR